MGITENYYGDRALERKISERQFAVAITFDLDKEKRTIENLELTTQTKEIPSALSDIIQLKVAREILLGLIAKMEGGEVEGRNLWAVSWEDELV